MQSPVTQLYPPELLAPPVARAAYSDRTAWLMATMSRFAYLRFESDEDLLEALAERLMAADNKRAIKSEIVAFITHCLAPKGGELALLNDSLGILGFELVETFSNGGTQAFLAKRDSDGIAVLAFRGTTDLTDVKTDLKLRFYTRDGVKVHDGFRQAFALVEPAITTAIGKLSDYKLYTTGHSLGGALAVIATKAFNSDNVAACYTFGSPKVGSLEFGHAVKPPIYRVVNAADFIPRVPVTWTIEALLLVIRLFKILPFASPFIVRLLQNVRGYSHHGDMRYLSACKSDFTDLQLIANPELPLRAAWLASRVFKNWRAGLTDHDIADYCDKLRAYALSRSEGNVSTAVMPSRKQVRRKKGAG